MTDLGLNRLYKRKAKIRNRNKTNNERKTTEKKGHNRTRPSLKQIFGNRLKKRRANGTRQRPVNPS